MMNKILYFLIFIMFFSCKKESIIIEDYNNNPPESESAETIVNSDKKPLKMVSPSDTVLIFVRQDGAPGMYLGRDN